MGFNKNKGIKKLIEEKLTDEIVNEATDKIMGKGVYGNPLETMQFRGILEGSNSAQQIPCSQSEIKAPLEVPAVNPFGDSNNEDLFQTLLTSFIIPSCYTFKYWIMINLGLDMRANEFKIECEDEELKDIVYKLIKNCIGYGKVGFVSKEIYGMMQYTDPSPWNGKAQYGILTPLPTQSSDIKSYGEAGIVLDNKHNKTFAVNEGNCAVLCWSDGQIGEFVTMIPHLCMDIYKKSVIDANASSIYAVPTCMVGDIENFKLEHRFNRNPYNGVKIAIIDTQGVNKNINKGTYDETNNQPHLAEAHTDLRYHQEYYNVLMGSEIGSAKGQTLSADVNLSFERCMKIRKERERRIELFLKKVTELTGIFIELKTQEDIEEENAEKGGEGIFSRNPYTEQRTGKANPKTNTETGDNTQYKDK